MNSIGDKTDIYCYCPICSDKIEIKSFTDTYYKAFHKHDNLSYLLRLTQYYIEETIFVYLFNGSREIYFSIERDNDFGINYTIWNDEDIICLNNLNLNFNDIGKLSKDAFIKKIKRLIILS